LLQWRHFKSWTFLRERVEEVMTLKQQVVFFAATLLRQVTLAIKSAGIEILRCAQNDVADCHSERSEESHPIAFYR
jgi:hypothetical protein